MTKSSDLANSINALSIPGARLQSGIGPDKVDFTQNGSNITRTVAEKLEDAISVLDYGAEGNVYPSRLLSEIYGTLAEAQAVYPHVTSLTQSVDWAGCQAALNAAAGKTVYFPAGIYGLTNMLTMPDNCKLQGGANGKLYPNFSTDWDGYPVPSWGYKAATLQCQGTFSDGAFLDPKSRFSMDSLVVRDPARAGRSLLKTAWSFYSIQNCTFQRLGAISPFNNAGSHGAFTFAANQVTACGMGGGGPLFGGALVDFKIYYNTFTTLYNSIVSITAGGGLNLIEGNRIEYGEGAPAIKLGTGSRYNVIAGNLFDAYSGVAIEFSQTGNENVVDNNLFWRNGRSASAGSKNDAHILLFASSNQIISNNIFIRGGADLGGANFGPSHLLSFSSCANNVGNKFVGNSTINSCDTSMMFFDEFGDSRNCIEFDVIDMVNPLDGSANTATDDLSSGLNRISLLASSTGKVRISQDRQVNSSANIRNLILEARANVGISGSSITPLTLTNGPSGSLNDMEGLENIDYGGLTYTIRRGAQYASAQPAGNRSNGNWGVGAQIFNSAPSAGGSLGWIKITSGSPDTWKTFGSISA